jgi:hypothetical protein
MNELPRIIPDVQMLPALTPEELAEKDALPFEEEKRFEVSPRQSPQRTLGHFTSGQPQYPRQYENETNLALSEAWGWLQAQGLIVSDVEKGRSRMRIGGIMTLKHAPARRKT